jgi:DNA topoisomerase III
MAGKNFGYDPQLVKGAPKMPEHVCPRCKTEALQLIKGKNGLFWGCSKYPVCRATFEDKAGEPDMKFR